MKAVAACSAASLLALVPVTANAAGYYVPDLGTVARARGGAFVADADDPTALAYNPAGLVGQKQSVLVDLTVLQLSETFTRNAADVPSDSTAPLSVTNHPPLQIVPELGYVRPLNDKLSIGVGLHAPAGPRYSFDASGAQRFTLTSLFLAEASYGAALAYRVHPRVSVGLELEGMLHQVKQDFVVSANQSTSPSEAPSNDERVTLDVTSTFTPNAIAGVKWEATDHLQVGAAFRPGATIKASGHLFDNTPGTPPAAQAQAVNFTFAVPALLRAGARWVQPVWDVEGDVVYEGWSDHPNEVVTPSGAPTLSNGATSATQQRHFTDAWSLRVGGGYQVSPPLKLLAGLYYETASVPDAYLDPGTLDSGKEALSVGASYDLSSKLVLSGNLAHTFLADRNISGSNQRQQSKFPLTPPPLTTVGNGSYSGSYDFLGVSVLIRL